MNIKANHLKLMAEFGCWPVWSDLSPYNIDPSDLPVSPELRDALYAWGRQYDDTFNPDDPASSCFSSQFMEEKFSTEGALLLNRLKVELGDEFELTLCL